MNQNNPFTSSFSQNESTPPQEPRRRRRTERFYESVENNPVQQEETPSSPVQYTYAPRSISFEVGHSREEPNLHDQQQELYQGYTNRTNPQKQQTNTKPRSYTTIDTQPNMYDKRKELSDRMQTLIDEDKQNQSRQNKHRILVSIFVLLFIGLIIHSIINNDNSTKQTNSDLGLIHGLISQRENADEARASWSVDKACAEVKSKIFQKYGEIPQISGELIYNNNMHHIVAIKYEVPGWRWKANAVCLIYGSSKNNCIVSDIIIEIPADHDPKTYLEELKTLWALY